MAQKLYEEQHIQSIADAIRYANSQSASYTAAQMGGAVRALKKTFGSKTFTENGVYSAQAQGYDGFAEVVVSVPSTVPVLEALSVSANGSYAPGGGVDGFSEVIVSVPSREPVLESLSVSSNGTFTPESGVDGFSEVVVSVSGSAGVLVSKTILSNGTYDAFLDDNADGYSQVVVSVPGSSEDTEELLSIIARSLSVISNSTIRYIGPSAFWAYHRLEKLYLGECLEIASYGLTNCAYMSEAQLPKCKKIEDAGFSNCIRLQSISIPMCESVSAYGFYGCYMNLSQIDLPACRSIGNSAFASCRALKSVSIPVCRYINPYAFAYCTELQSIDAPEVFVPNDFAFSSCYALSYARFSKASMLGSACFANCSKLATIILLSNSVVRMPYSTAFVYTPIVRSTYLGYFGSIYVPASLVEAYKSAANWSYFSDRITAYTGE